MWRNRFGVLNDLYNELVSEGIEDVKIMGINGFQYIDDSIDCMMCTDACTSSTCSSGPRILPWSQDLDDGINCQDENSDCSWANFGMFLYGNDDYTLDNHNNIPQTYSKYKRAYI